MVRRRLWSYVEVTVYRRCCVHVGSFRWTAYTLQNINSGVNITEVHICHVGVTLAELEFEFDAVVSQRNFVKVLKLCASNVLGVTVIQV